MKNRSRKSYRQAAGLVLNPTTNAKRVSPLKLDPTRTFTLRRAFITDLRKRFARLKGKVLKLIAVDDALGLKNLPRAIPLSNTSQGEYSQEALKQADFVRLPSDVKGTNCGNCKYQEGGVCQNPRLKGLEVTPRDCCALWDAGGVVRPWSSEVENFLGGSQTDYFSPPEGRSGFGGEGGLWGGLGLTNGAFNAFCPTGPGGGKDDSCSPSGTPHERVLSLASYMTPTMQGMVKYNLKEVKSYKSKEEMAKAWSQEGHRESDFVVPGHADAGYDRATGTLHYVEGTPDHILAHELGHVLDGRMESVSGSPEFQRAWKAEGKKVSEYAGYHPAEGLAELMRVRSEKGAKAVEKLAPKMVKALKSLGYKWEEGTSNSARESLEGYPGTVYYTQGGEPYLLINGLVVDETYINNCAPGQMRDATTGRCGPGVGINIPREEMPQIRGEDLGEFITWARGQGVGISYHIKSTGSLSPTQKEFRQERVDALPQEALREPILISRDSYILDGTHRWVKAWQGGRRSMVPTLLIDLPLQDALSLMLRFPKVKFVGNAFCPTGEGGGQDNSCSSNRLGIKGVSAHIQAALQAVGMTRKDVNIKWDETSAQEISAVGKRTIVLAGSLRTDLRQLVRSVAHEAEHLKMTRDNTTHDMPLDEIEKRARAAEDKAERHVFGNLDTHNSLTYNDRWRFNASSEKIEEFQKWLAQQFKEGGLTGEEEESLWERYISAGYQRGAGRAFDDTERVRKTQAHGDRDKELSYAGGRDTFLRSSFAHPVAKEKVELLAGRAFDEMEDVTREMSNKMSRVLADGLVEGKSPKEVGRELSDEIDISRSRAETIARTELIRAHAEGQLTALEQLGVEEVGVEVEWSSTGDDAVCEECAPMEGVVLSIAEARGMLPRHPNCRCAWIPAGVGEDDEGQKRGKEADKAFKESGLDEGDGDEVVNLLEPYYSLPTDNAFCPGEGLKDNSCSSHSSLEDRVKEAYDKLYISRPKMKASERKTLEAQYFKDVAELNRELDGKAKGKVEAKRVGDAAPKAQEASSQKYSLERTSTGMGKLPSRTSPSVLSVPREDVEKLIGSLDPSSPHTPIHEVGEKLGWSPERTAHVLVKAQSEGRVRLRTSELSTDHPHEMKYTFRDSADDLIGRVGLAHNTLVEVTDNSFCPTGPGGGVDSSCSPSHGGVAPIATDLYRKMNKEERSEATKLEREGTGLNKKVKDGSATQQEKDRADQIRERMAEIRKQVREREHKGEAQTQTTSTTQSQSQSSSTTSSTSSGSSSFSKGQHLTREAIKERLDKAVDPSIPSAGIQRQMEMRKILDEVGVDIGSDGVHGMTYPEPLKMAKIDGVEFQWVDDKMGLGMEHASRTLAEVVHEGLPQRLWESNRRVVFSTQRNSQDPYWEKEYSIPGFRSNATGGDGTVCAYNSAMGIGTFAHESGHNLATKTWGSVTPSPSSAYGRAQAKEPPVTEYGSKRPAEDFAEACKIYTTAKGRSKWFSDHPARVFPEKWKAVEDLIERGIG